ncbi:DUF1127 domain-containing protein [Pseudomonas sp. JS3066]|jgi:uncharacterized protein YjiS (DUF1127 family)|uniref:DUF1127 domain-containing protein n=1 Tax=unclassified Pseudomonas TaxID=196821 RepID=UPI000EA9ECB8|nr:MULTISPECIES: DUF1127 domain-containing protein [unclassified Pseudomonas]AYF86529.1 DUF1127 domain-containing protein [Pseudomonas sp. DY-1]MDH4654748.1 DUF1127 domain-containing protein [Pseudomonas sp. BN606]MRK23867.1 DUF1127 domain-containing protein [Pseudomonas sp. JG-B]WVK96015.1 DUF1127 domain-containing protein [Pseudomonas sp. JS3066]
MNDTPHPWPAEVWHRRYNLAHPRRMIATWSERKRFRLELERMAKANPHLIEDIGLTRRQAEREIAKPFWQE